MIFFFHPEAEEEFLAAVNYYEERDARLGYNFSLEVFTTIQNIVAYPNAWPIVEDDVRRCLINRFPFGILYSIDSAGVFILAVMHQRRHPDYWKHRHSV